METNKLYIEDCLTTMFFMETGCVDLVVTSPPYDDLRKYKGFSFDFENIAKELFRVLKPGGVIVWVVGDQTKNGSETGTSFKQALYFKEIGFRLYDTMIYQKANYAPKTHRRYEQSFEYMFVLSKGIPKTFNPIKVPCQISGSAVNWKRKGSNVSEGVFRRRDEIITVSENKIRDNIWCYGVGGSKTGHPAPFPEKLAKDHILSWSNEGDLIYDPFAGSGTTLKVAQENNRNWIASEIAPEYGEMIKTRLQI